MAMLLLASACFSGAEAALFTLAANNLGQNNSIARRLLAQPASALTLILLVNLLINLAFFASSAAWSLQFSPQSAALVAMCSILALVVFGEVLPKVLAHRHPMAAGRVMLLPVALLDVFLGRAARLFSRRFLRTPKPHSLGATEIDDLIEEQGQHLLSGNEQSLLRHILEMGTLRAGAVRKPLSEVLRFEQNLPLAKARQTLREHGESFAAVENRHGEVCGILDLVKNPKGQWVGEVMQLVPILPEVAPLANGITLLRQSQTPFILLVDEYGSEAGIIERGRWADTLLDRPEPRDATDRPAVRKLSANRYQLDANLPLHVFVERFGEVGEVDAKVDTIAGLISERLARVPDCGDQLEIICQSMRLKFEIIECLDARPLSVQLTQLPLTKEDQ